MRAFARNYTEHVDYAVYPPLRALREQGLRTCVL